MKARNMVVLLLLVAGLLAGCGAAAAVSDESRSETADEVLAESGIDEPDRAASEEAADEAGADAGETNAELSDASDAQDMETSDEDGTALDESQSETADEDLTEKEDDSDYYSVATNFSRAEVEAFAGQVRAAVVNGDWTACSRSVRRRFGECGWSRLFRG